MATKKQSAPTGEALVLCAGTFDGLRTVPAGAVVEGAPAEVLAEKAHWLDVHPDAVAHARASGALVVPFVGE